jgi:YHS domain-containing protein
MAVFYLLFKILKSFLIRNKRPDDDGDHLERRFDRKIESSELIQDPNCKVFFPKNDGIPLKFKGDTILFCSEDCMKEFVEKNI